MQWLFLGQRSQLHRITEYPEWEGTHRDHQTCTGHPKNPTLSPRASSKSSLVLSHCPWELFQCPNTLWMESRPFPDIHPWHSFRPSPWVLSQVTPEKRSVRNLQISTRSALSPPLCSAVVSQKSSLKAHY